MQVTYRVKGENKALSYKEYQRHLTLIKSSEDVLLDKICNIDFLENLFIAICIELIAWGIVKIVTG